MRTLTGQGVPNITQPSPEYPFGKYKDKTSALTNDGTELSERTLGDTYQGMLNTITRTGVTPNNEPETALLSQFADAVELLKPVATCVVGSDDGGTTFKVLSSIIRDPEITLTANCKTNDDDAAYLSAIFKIQRNGTLDSSHNYIVTATPVYDFKHVIDAQIPMVALGNTPRVMIGSGKGNLDSPYFNNSGIYLYDLSNLFFIFPNAVSPSEAKALARAILTIYDAGPVS